MLDNNSELDKIFNSNNIFGNILLVPNWVKSINKEFGDRLAITGNINTIIFEEGSQLESIESAALFNCLSVKEIHLTKCKNLKSIQNLAFTKCTNLKNIYFPKNCQIEDIGDFAFAETAIFGFKLNGSNLRLLGENAFRNCQNLVNIDLSNNKNLAVIKKHAFSDCPNLIELDLRGCENIKRFMLQHCRASDVYFSKNICGDFEIMPELEQYVRFGFNSFAEHTIIHICNQDKEIFSFSAADEKYKYLQILKLGLFDYAKKLKLTQLCEKNPSFVNTLANKQEIKMVSDNWAEIEEILAQNKVLSSYLLATLRKLGYFGIYSENPTKKSLISYKNLLAKSFIKHNHIPELENLDNKNDYAIIYQQTINRLARNIPIQTLVLNFFKNEILPHKNANKLCYELYSAHNDYHANLDFASFVVANCKDILESDNINIIKVGPTSNSFDEDFKSLIRISQLHNNFNSILKNSNKMVVTRSDKNRLTLRDCNYNNIYKNILIGNENLANLCGQAHISQEAFEFLQNLYEKGKEVEDFQILDISPDQPDFEISYKFIEKSNPLGLVLGNITNCCQVYGNNGQSCMEAGQTDPNCGFITFNHGDKIIGQSWVWFDSVNHVIALDNIEIPEVYQKFVDQNQQEFLNCVVRVCQNFKKTMQENGNKVDHVIVGKHATDFDLSPQFEIETINTYNCPIEVDGKPCYSDIQKQGQYFIIKNGKLNKKHSNAKEIEK